MAPSITPQSQALAARQQQIADAQQDADHRNIALKSWYAEACRQWQWNFEQQKAGTPLPPVPAAPATWVLVPHAYTFLESQYDAAYPGIPALVDIAQTGPSLPQYAPPTAPPAPKPGTVINIGPYLRDGEYAALPDDNMPDGYMTSGPGGTILRKITKVTPFGTAQWYQVIG